MGLIAWTRERLGMRVHYSLMALLSMMVHREGSREGSRPGYRVVTVHVNLKGYRDPRPRPETSRASSLLRLHRKPLQHECYGYVGEHFDSIKNAPIRSRSRSYFALSSAAQLVRLNAPSLFSSFESEPLKLTIEIMSEVLSSCSNLRHPSKDSTSC